MPVMITRRVLPVVVLLALIAAACGDSGVSTGSNAVSDTVATTISVAPSTTTSTTMSSTTTTTIDPVSLLRVNDIQVLGSHNSYHLRPIPVVLAALGVLSQELAESIDYSHLPLTEQLDTYGIRQLELDVFADPEGGLWSSRQALPVINLPAESGIAELDLPGFKVLHTQDFDFETTCFSLVSCLTEAKAWSDANQNHLPVMVLIEFKDETVAEAAAGAGVDISVIQIPFTDPVPTTPAILDALDAEIRSVFPDDRLITPDDLRGEHATLDEAVKANGWPLLSESRGKFMFALDNGGTIRDMYRAPSPVLAGRVMFTSSDPGDPDGAFVKINEPIGNVDRINEVVAAGYIVRTRTDSPTSDARTGSTVRRDAALSTGAQFLSTDYYVENPDFGTGYTVTLESRCNPVTNVDICTEEAVAE